MTLVVDAPAGSTAPRSANPTAEVRRAGTQASESFSVRTIWLLITAMIALLTGTLLLNLTLIGELEHQAAQHRLFTSFRNVLAAGTAPVTQVNSDGHLYPLGTPVAIIRIPSIGVNEVVAEGTTPQVLTGGPGHVRATVLPGEAGVCQIFGRAGSYGGPFGRISSLRRGAVIRAIDGLGTSVYRVIDVRRAHDINPPLPAGEGRITLVTASGTHFMPSGVVRVDAQLVTPQAQATSLSPVTLMPSEFSMKGDNSSLWQLVLWIEALVIVSIGSTWAWNKWGRPQAVIVGLPCFLLVGFYVSDQVTRLLPNLL